ncbi:MAG: DUF4855 domain-containing protein [Armatimonadota bacterium]
MGRLHLMMTALPLAAAVVSVPSSSQELGYQPPGDQAAGGIEDLVLIYHGQQARVTWTCENLLPYVAYLDEDGRPRDWFFDGFLFIEFATDDGVYIHHYRQQTRLPTVEDWVWLAECWFRPNVGLAGLEQAVAQVAAAIGPPDRRAKVVITLPIPLAQDHSFGPLPGEQQPLDLADPDDARRALAWYVDHVRARWDAAGYQHLELVGFYWTAESVPPSQVPLARWTSEYLHGLGLKHFWIPYFGAAGYDSWRDAGFDAVMLQPNYFFTEDDRSLTHFRTHVLRVQLANTGVEVEFDTRALTDERFRRRFYAYLDAGAFYGWMTDALLGYYEGGRAVLEFYRGGQQGRALYDAVYRFVQGTWEPTGENEFEPVTPIQRDNTTNLALAARGAVVHGAPEVPEWKPGISAEKMIDGEIHHYGGMHGFTAFYIPGAVTIELPEVATVARTQVMLFDLDGRFFRYRIDTSVDGQTWEPAVDKSEGEWRSWQVDRFAPRPARFVRFTCTHNSVNQICQVVELEVYAD